MGPAAGRCFGRYQLDRPARDCDTAVVWHAWDTGHARYVTVTLLAPPFDWDRNDPFEQLRLLAERVVRLDHPNILTILDFGEQDAWLYTVSPFIPHGSAGGTLVARLNRGPWTVPDALTVLAPLASALDYAHGHGFVHLGVSPSSVLLGEPDRVVLADFGIIQLLLATAPLHRVGPIGGLPMYVSPEQVRGDAAGPASDVYSLGVIAYELLTGRPPFQAERPVELLRGHALLSPPSPRSINPSLSDRTERALAQVLAKRPEERFRSAADFVRALGT